MDFRLRGETTASERLDDELNEVEEQLEMEYI